MNFFPNVQDLNISLITVTFNAENTIRRCIESVMDQKFKSLQYIIIDGGSTDNTLQIINNYGNSIDVVVSEPDRGIYDAMNKGIRLAKGNIVGMLNADDFFADSEVLSAVKNAFVNNNVDIIYGDLDYLDGEDQIVRKWRSGAYARRNFNFGWMPPHPTFYCKRNLFEKFGFYSTGYGSAADYELMVRYLYFNKLSALYINKVMIKMKMGGISNKSYFNRVKGLFFDLKAMRKNGIMLPYLTIVLKPFSKIVQFF